MSSTSPFPPTARVPGQGLIHAILLPPSSFTLTKFFFAYPLKLISSSTPTDKCITVFILSYGGGLVSNDKINLNVTLDDGVKLCLLTQGSTKVFGLRPLDTLTSQTLTVSLAPHSALLLLPDPVQPFADSVYSQLQTFTLPPNNTASLIVLDWVTEGRSARGEKWDMKKFSSRNDFFESGHPDRPDGGRRLLLRDSLILNRPGGEEDTETLGSRMDSLSVFSTLLIRGPKFTTLSAYILNRFSQEPRIGSGGNSWNWDKNRQDKPNQSQKQFMDVIWTAAIIRGFLVVKVSAKEPEEARLFLRDLLLEGKSEVLEGDNNAPDVLREFGLGALRCLE